MKDIKFTFSSLFLHAGGYSELARNLAIVLDELGALAKLDIRDGKNFQSLPINQICGEEFMKLKAKFAEDHFYPTPTAVLQFVPPFMMLPCKDAPNVGITMFETQVPESWYANLKHLQYLAVHDDFQKQLFAKAPVKLLDWSPWVSNPLHHSFKSDSDIVPGNKYFLTVGVARVHKNQGKIIDAFREFRKSHPEYYLVIKAITEDAEYDDYRNKLTADDHVYVLPGPISTPAIDKLYCYCHAYISASMCEGLDMPAAKAMMAGKPVIMARHTGHQSWMPKYFSEMDTTAVNLSTLKSIHPRYREPNMMGYDMSVEEILRHMEASVAYLGDYTAATDDCMVFSRGACKESMRKIIEMLQNEK